MPGENPQNLEVKQADAQKIPEKPDPAAVADAKKNLNFYIRNAGGDGFSDDMKKSDIEAVFKDAKVRSEKAVKEEFQEAKNNYDKRMRGFGHNPDEVRNFDQNWQDILDSETKRIQDNNEYLDGRRVQALQAFGVVEADRAYKTYEQERQNQARSTIDLVKAAAKQDAVKDKQTEVLDIFSDTMYDFDAMKDFADKVDASIKDPTQPLPTKVQLDRAYQVEDNLLDYRDSKGEFGGVSDPTLARKQNALENVHFELSQRLARAQKLAEARKILEDSDESED